MENKLVEFNGAEQQVIFDLLVSQVETYRDTFDNNELREEDTWKQFRSWNHLIDELVTIGGFTEPTTSVYLRGRTFYHAEMNRRYEADYHLVPKTGGFDRSLEFWMMMWVIQDAHRLVTENNDKLREVCEDFDCSEFELFSVFESWSQEMGFDLVDEE